VERDILYIVVVVISFPPVFCLFIEFSGHEISGINSRDLRCVSDFQPEVLSKILHGSQITIENTKSDVKAS